jgi:hypothetical protein
MFVSWGVNSMKGNDFTYKWLNNDLQFVIRKDWY